MRIRIVLIVALLLVTPTAILTLIAARSLRDRELFLEVQIKNSALNAARAVSRRIEDRLRDDLEDLRLAVSSALDRGARPRDLDEAVSPLLHTRPLLAGAYVFMNPWGLVYPEEATVTTETAGPFGAHDQLIQVLRREVAVQPAVWSDPVSFSAAGRLYCFARIAERRSVYVGFVLRSEALKQLLDESLRAFSGGGISLSAFMEGAGGVGEEGVDGVEIRDSIDPDRESIAPRFGVAGYRMDGAGAERMVLATARLTPPLNHIQVQAVATDAAELRRTTHMRWRMHAWGLLLLAGAVLAGIGALLREASSQVRAAQARSDFLVGVSHDLRTPLASVKLLAESLYKGRVESPERRLRFLGVIIRECERLHQLVERVLFFVKYGQDAVGFFPMAVDPAVLARSAADIFMARFRLHGETGDPASDHTRGGVASPDAGPNLNLRVDGNIPEVRLDRAAITQVLLNLLDNAWKYTLTKAGTLPDADARKIDVCVGADRRRDLLGRPKLYASIAVRDRGIGMSDTEKRLLFGRYYRTATAADRNISGVGLGLALSRRVIRAHGGRIEVESCLGKGSTFTVLLPAATEMIDDFEKANARAGKGVS